MLISLLVSVMSYQYGPDLGMVYVLLQGVLVSAYSLSYTMYDITYLMYDYITLMSLRSQASQFHSLTEAGNEANYNGQCL